MSTNTENKTMVYRLETVNIHVNLQERRCQGGRYLWDHGSHFPRGRVMLSVVQQRLLPHARIHRRGHSAATEVKAAATFVV